MGLTEAGARGWVEERNLRCQKIVDGHTGQQHCGQGGENYHTSGILEERERQCGVMIKFTLNIRSSIVNHVS